MVISGHLNRFTIQSSETRSNIFITSDKRDSVIGNVYSTTNLTLVERNKGFKSMKPTELILIGNLVSTHEDLFTQFGKVESQRPLTQHFWQVQSWRHSSSEEAHTSGRVPASRKDLEDLFNKDSHSSSSSSSEERTHSDSLSLPHLNESLQNPFSPIFIGISGSKNFKDIIKPINQAAVNLVVQIAKGMQDYFTEESDEMIERFTILQDLLRTMDVKQLLNVEQELFTRSKLSDDVGQAINKVFYKIMAQIGTGPALLRLMEWINSEKLHNAEASMLLMRIPKTVRTPTAEYMERFYVSKCFPTIKFKTRRKISICKK